MTVKTMGDPCGAGHGPRGQRGWRNAHPTSDGGVELQVDGTDRLVPAVLSAAERGGFEVTDLSVARPSLETVFISLTGKELRD